MNRHHDVKCERRSEYHNYLYRGKKKKPFDL